jgi:hypothetical protein
LRPKGRAERCLGGSKEGTTSELNARASWCAACCAPARRIEAEKESGHDISCPYALAWMRSKWRFDFGASAI